MAQTDPEDASPSQGAPAGSSNPLRVLRNRNFARLFFAGAASTAGFAIGQVAIIWLVFTMTGSAIDVAFVGVMYTIAAVCFSVFSGTLVDREDRRRLMIISDLVRCASLAATTVFLLVFGFNLILILVVAFILGAFTTLFQPAERALTPSLIEKEEVADANGLVQITLSIAQFASNAAGGILIAAVGVLAAFGLNSGTFLVSALLLGTIAVRRSGDPEARGGEGLGAPPTTPRTGFLEDARGGFAYLVGQKSLLSVTVMAGFQNIFYAMITPFFVIYVTKVLAGDATVYGVFLALFSLGIGPGSILVGRVGAVRWAGKLWLVLGAIQGLIIVALVYTSSALVALVLIFLIGLLLGFVNTTWLTIVQLIVPGEMQGRYFGLDQLGSFAIIPLGQVFGAFVIARFGVHWAFVVAGGGLMAVSLIFAQISALRGMNYRGRGAGPAGRDATSYPVSDAQA